MIRADYSLCLCGHTKAYHDTVRIEPIGPDHRAWRCCAGNWPRRKCRCQRFRRAIAQPSDPQCVKNPGLP